MNPQLDTSQGLHLPQPEPVAPQQQATNDIMQPAGQQYTYTPLPTAPATPPVVARQPGDEQGAIEQQETVQLDDASGNLDEEWINKARELTDRYQADPYNQSRELSKLKTEYLRVRYSKEIKATKDQS